MFSFVFFCRTIYWAEAGVIKSSQDDGSDIIVIATKLGNVTAIDVSHGNFSFHVITALTLARLLHGIVTVLSERRPLPCQKPVTTFS